MATPSSARRWLIQVVFVSTRSPRSISVPMVTISALSMLFPSIIPVFYNPAGGRLREHAHCDRERRSPGPLEALGGTLWTHHEGGEHRRRPGKGPRPRRGPDAPFRPYTRRGSRDWTGRVPEARTRVGTSRWGTGEAEPEASARAGRGGAGKARARRRRRRDFGGGSGPHHGEARDGTARARTVRGGQDRTSPRLPERGAPAQAGPGRPTRGRDRVSAACHRPQRGARQGCTSFQPRGPRAAEGRSHRAGLGRAVAKRIA